ncbi:MAG: nucleotidyl transferase AbiEii/AbiGii toxin family protein [Lachnospiraceae bacterium]|nr:nucleotidyl transferase AbiEii/AbiGii toxin family protein [Lachnospiraceae bacterium]
MNLHELTEEMKRIGYEPDDAEARVCQDVILKALSLSPLSRNVTIKGGVVMRSITNEVRRATQDMDIDFIRYSLADESIDMFIEKINTIEGITITRVGDIKELNQQDYHGKRVIIHIKDSFSNIIESKIDLGVHKHFDVEQEEYCFDKS